MAWESKAQGFLLVMLLISILNYVVGIFIPKDFNALEDVNLANLTAKQTHLKKINSEGHFSLTGALTSENLLPEFSEGENFFTVFSIFFPAATGILAGSNISGDLKDPSVAIPKGKCSQSSNYAMTKYGHNLRLLNLNFDQTPTFGENRNFSQNRNFGQNRNSSQNQNFSQNGNF